MFARVDFELRICNCFLHSFQQKRDGKNIIFLGKVERTWLYVLFVPSYVCCTFRSVPLHKTIRYLEACPYSTPFHPFPWNHVARFLLGYLGSSDESFGFECTVVATITSTWGCSICISLVGLLLHLATDNCHSFVTLHISCCHVICSIQHYDICISCGNVLLIF